jgi:hypothetical protein
MDPFDKLINTSPEWGPFLVAFALTLTFMRYVLRVLVENGLVRSLRDLASVTDALPRRIAEAIVSVLKEGRDDA